MAVRIIQIENDEPGISILKVAGKLYLPDAAILEQSFDEAQIPGERRVRIDLAEVSFLAAAAAAVLNGMRQRGAILTGTSFFVAEVLESAAARRDRKEGDSHEI